MYTLTARLVHARPCMYAYGRSCTPVHGRSRPYTPDIFMHIMCTLGGFRRPGPAVDIGRTCWNYCVRFTRAIFSVPYIGLI